jgi:hypothetical protein
MLLESKHLRVKEHKRRVHIGFFFFFLYFKLFINIFVLIKENKI